MLRKSIGVYGDDWDCCQALDITEFRRRSSSEHCSEENEMQSTRVTALSSDQWVEKELST